MIENTPALLAAVGGVISGAAAMWGARNSRRAGVAGDEREARRDEAAQRRDTIADRDGLIDQLQQDVTALRERVDTAERERAIDARWARDLIDQIYRGEPPPPRPRPTSP